MLDTPIVQSNFSHHRFGCYYYEGGRNWSSMHARGVAKGLWSEALRFDDVISIFEQWIEEEVKPLVQDENTDDLWSYVVTETPLSIIASPVIAQHNTSSFSADEKAVIQSALAEFRRLLTVEFAPSEAQASEIHSKLTYLVEATNRLNKFDWQGLIIGTILSIVITLSLDTERGRQLWQILLRAFEQARRLIP
jgi:hypothetical protein